MFLKGNFSVRFHLARGKHYKFWQIKDLNDKDCEPTYINPNTHQLFLSDCELVCNENKAQQVYARGVKDVCGWIKCKSLYAGDINIFTDTNTNILPRLTFNPIVDTKWRISKNPECNMNNYFVSNIITKGNKCYIPVGSFITEPVPL